MVDSLLGPMPTFSRAGGTLLLYPSSVQDSYFLPNSTENNPLLQQQILNLPADGTFVDLGANSGFYSLMASKCLGANGQIISIEPSWREFSRLFWAKSINKYQCQWEALNLAIGASGSKRINTSVGHTGMNQIVENAEFGRDLQHVSLAVLDDVLRLYNISTVDLLKIDIEGYELCALKSFSGLLSSGAIKAIVCEITDKYLRSFGGSKDELYKLMIDCGFSWEVGPQSNRWQYDELFVKDTSET